MNRAMLIALSTTAVACAPEVPAEPTWVDDVRPILVANCVRCHSAPPIGGAPDYFRLDKYDDETIADGPDANDEPDLIGGAASYATINVIYTESELMPPRFPLTDRQVEVLRAWVEAGTPRGERAGNAAPTIELEEDPTLEAEGAELSYRISDRDGDLVTGLLWAEPTGGGDRIFLSNELFGGRGTTTWQTSSMAPGTYALVAELDDGSGPTELALAEIEVSP